MRTLAAPFEVLGRPETALVPAAAVRFLRNAALFAAAPFIGLAYALAFPFIGFGALVWLGARALVEARTEA
jgi:hypothetical protein